MKSLYILRHAKSSWEQNVDDHKRPLKKRGKKDALLVSNHVKKMIPAPQKIITSDANRAHSTALYFKNAWDISDKNFIINPELYDFGGQKVLEIIKDLNDKQDCLMIVGHNHALTSIANMLGDATINNIPTCGFVVIEFNVDSWKYTNYGFTSKIIFPRDLKPKK